MLILLKIVVSLVVVWICWCMVRAVEESKAVDAERRQLEELMNERPEKWN